MKPIVPKPQRCSIYTRKIEAKVRRAGKGKRLVIGNGAETEVNAGLVELIKEAFAIRNQLLSGSHDSIEAMSGRLKMNKGRLTSLVRLSYLGPEIVRALLASSQANALTPSRLLRLSKNLPRPRQASPANPSGHMRRCETGSCFLTPLFIILAARTRRCFRRRIRLQLNQRTKP